MPGMLKLAAPLVIALAAASLAACSKPQPQQTSARDEAPLHHILVLQGDALVIDGRHVRLANAEAPARMPRARCWAEALAAREARKRLSELTVNAHDIDIEPTGQKDEYEREVARVSFDGVDLGEALVADGWAVRPRKPIFDWCGPLSSDMRDPPNVAALSDIGR